MEENLPEGWVETTIEAIANINPGLDLFSLPESTLVSFVPMAAVEAGTGRIDSSTKRELREVKKGYTAFQEGDILFAKITPCMENGKFTVAQSLSSRIGFGSTEFHVLRPENDIDAYLLYYYLSQGSFRQLARVAMTGSAGQLRVPATFLRDVPYPLAPANEQHRIVSVIEQQFTRLDSAVASLKSAQARVKQYRASLLKAAVEGELTKEWRTEHPASETGTQLLTRILKERRARWEEEQLAKMREKGIMPKDDKWKQAYKEPQGPDVENLPVLPEGWCWTTLESIAHIQLGKMLSPKAYEMHLIQLDYLRNENIRWGYIDYSDIKKMGFKEGELEKYSLLPNDLLICEGGEPGRCAVYKGNMEYIGDEKRLMYQKALHRVRMIENIVSPYFIQLGLQHYVVSKVIIPKFSETTIQHLPLEKISVLPFPLPPLAEIEQIVSEVEARLSNIAKLEETIKNNLKRAEHERQSILQEAFAGRLVPQDPEDEPASVLLERIREERKKRDGIEKVLRVDRKGVKMDSAKRRRTRKAGVGQQTNGLYEKLVEAGQPLAPDELFKRVGLKTEEQPESVEVFYEEVRADVEDALIEVVRSDYEHVLLQALEPSADVLARTEEEAGTVQMQKAELPEQTALKQPTLWDV